MLWFMLAWGCTEQPDQPGLALDCDAEWLPVEGETGRLVGFAATHNYIRSEIDVPELVWDDELADVSAQWIDHLATENNCTLEHTKDGQYGENLAWNAGFQSSPCQVVSAWLGEQEYYNYNKNSCSDVCGHYTQLVWANTELVGCAFTTCADSSEIWMCSYDPPGNVVGEKPY